MPNDVFLCIQIFHFQLVCLVPMQMLTYIIKLEIVMLCAC